MQVNDELLQLKHTVEQLQERVLQLELLLQRAGAAMQGARVDTVS